MVGDEPPGASPPGMSLPPGVPPKTGINRAQKEYLSFPYYLSFVAVKDFNACTIIQPEETHEVPNVPVFQNCARLFSVKQLVGIHGLRRD